MTPVPAAPSPPASPALAARVFRDEAGGDPITGEQSPARPAAAKEEGFTFRGVRLHPFSFARSSLFAQHRLAMGAPSLRLVVEDVDAFLGDALRILWLCSHGPEDWAELRSSPPQLQVVMDNWADAGPADPVAAVLLGLQLYAGASSSSPPELTPLQA